MAAPRQQEEEEEEEEEEPLPGEGGSHRPGQMSGQRAWIGAERSRWVSPAPEEPSLSPVPRSLADSWVELPYLGQDPQSPERAPTLACAPHADMERILLDAQMEAERSEARADSPLLALEPPGVEDPRDGQREDPERPAQVGTVAWAWSSPPKHLPPKDLACVAPACPALLSPALHRKRGVRDPHLLLLVIPSLVLSHVLALGLGICIGKRLAPSSASGL